MRDHLITWDAGGLDADFRGIVRVIMINHNPEKTFTIRTGDWIAQCVFMKKYNLEFQKVFDMAMLSITKRGADGFGLTGGITKIIKLDDSDSENNKNQMLILPKKSYYSSWLEWIREKGCYCSEWWIKNNRRKGYDDDWWW